MHSIEKKKHGPSRHGRALLLAAALALLCGSVGAYLLLNRPEEQALPESPVTYGELMRHGEEEVLRLAVTLRSGESWAIRREEDGSFRLEGADGWLVSEDMAERLLRVTCVISYEEVLTDDPADYQAELADFGLQTPRVTAEMTYTDGQSVTLRVGDASGMPDETWFYMTVDGDDRLFALDKGTVEELSIQRALLHPVEQPTLHKARMDEITFADGAGRVLARWQLDGAVTDSDASTAWRLTAPWPYPADEEAMDNLRSNLANIRLGAYEGEATAENLARCGLEEPRFVLTIHQAAGTTNATGEDGAVTQVDWPESTFTLTVGGAKNDNVDYVCVGDSVYITSHFSLNVFMGLDALNTVSRYPVMVAVGNLESLTVKTEAGEDVYRVDRQARVTENNELVADEDGQAVYDVTCTRNGESISYDAFEAAYIRMETATVSGRLPDGWTAQEEPHTIFTFVSRQGRTHTVALTRFDALHDAVVVDGCALFYLIRGGLAFSVE